MMNLNLYSNFFYDEVLKVGSLILFAIFLAFVIIGLSYVFSNSAPDAEKIAAYECGFDPYEDARNIFDVRFYLVALLFVIFDLEAVYFYPWCLSLSYLSDDGVFAMFDFILELLVGFYYAWKIGALDWQ